jgi:hypothetical protein
MLPKREHCTFEATYQLLRQMALMGQSRLSMGSGIAGINGLVK